VNPVERQRNEAAAVASQINMNVRELPMIYRSVLIATLAAIAPIAAYGQSKPTVTVVNPVGNPVNTRITNTVVPVEISNADPIAVLMAPAATSLEKYRAAQVTVSSAASSNSADFFTASEATYITGALLQVNAGGTSGSCTYTFTIANASGAFVAPLVSVDVFAGRSLSTSAVPFPNLTLPAGFKVRYFLANDTGFSCAANIVLYMSRT
jgi:hypothetical protein